MTAAIITVMTKKSEVKQLAQPGTVTGVKRERQPSRGCSGASASVPSPSVLEDSSELTFYSDLTKIFAGSTRHQKERSTKNSISKAATRIVVILLTRRNDYMNKVKLRELISLRLPQPDAVDPRADI
jgi:hypothetical protein